MRQCHEGGGFAIFHRNAVGGRKMNVPFTKFRYRTALGVALGLMASAPAGGRVPGLAAAPGGNAAAGC